MVRQWSRGWQQWQLSNNGIVDVKQVAKWREPTFLRSLFLFTQQIQSVDYI